MSEAKKQAVIYYEKPDISDFDPYATINAMLVDLFKATVEEVADGRGVSVVWVDRGQGKMATMKMGPDQVEARDDIGVEAFNLFWERVQKVAKNWGKEG